MTIEEMNALDAEAAERLFRRCCGSTRWAREMTAQRPFPNATAVENAADRIWTSLDTRDHVEAFAAHPRIGGARGAGRPGETGVDRDDQDWAAREQAGVNEATGEIRARLAAVNRAYEARFGFIYIVCATGKSAAEMLELAERRLTRTIDEELAAAAGEQRKITHLRLAKLFPADINR